MCLYKNLQADGSSTAECPCPRYIPQEEPQPGPRVCRDCEHWESLHPAAEAPKTSPIAELMARIKPQMDKARHPAPVADEDARRESNAGFKKVSEEHKGRGGATKYQKKGGKSSKSAEKVKTVGQIFFIPDAFFGNPDSSDADDDARRAELHVKMRCLPTKLTPKITLQNPHFQRGKFGVPTKY
ncbi:hypothetical protein DFH09DRAFT_1079136 [Mycena vulgaris]|nr:hypothetical protein DFH09DRAFT_1079136 [Mycena vulgaris]